MDHKHEKRHLNLSTGLFYISNDSYKKNKFPGIVASTSLAYTDLLSVDIHLEMFHYSLHQSYPIITNKDGVSTSLYLGMTGRSYAAALLPIFLIIAFDANPIVLDFGSSY